MNAEHEKELLDLMMANIEESSFIASHYNKALGKLRSNFRSDVIEVLKQKLNKEYYTIKEGQPVRNKYSQLWIHLKSNPQPQFLFGVESFSGSGHVGGNMFVGIINMHNSPVVAELADENKINKGWRQTRFLKTEDKKLINLGDNDTLKILNNTSSEDYKALLDSCCDTIVKFVKDYEKKIPKEVFVVKEKVNQ